MVVKPGSRVHDVAGGCSGPFLLFTKRQYTEQLRDTQGEQLLDMLRSQQQHMFFDGEIDKDKIIDLCGLGNPWSHNPGDKQFDVPNLIDNYISIFKQREQFYL